MSLVELRVELPAYSRSFNVQVPFDGTIFNVKQEIFRSCPGKPRVEGQKLIWRGRYLTDEERVNDLWKSLDEPRIVHLAVHPSGWSGPPPTTPSSVFTATSESLPVPPPSYPHLLQSRSGRLNSAQSTDNISMDYIQWKHDSAICVLLYGWITPWANANDIQHSRSLAVSFVQSHGYQWPIVLDEEFPTSAQGGVYYEQKTIDGLPYLCIVDPTAIPTACQLHAIKILSYTFSLLSLNSIPTSIIRPIPSNLVPANGTLDVNTLLQHLGLPPVRVQEPQGVNNHHNPPNRALRELREIPVRPLLVPLLLLVFRTCLLLYFVAPTRKPVFGLLILAWMVYEIWQPIRNAVRRNLQRAVVLEGQGIRNNADADRADGNNPVNVPEGGERRDEGQQPNVPGPEAPPVAQPPNAAPRAAAIDGGSLLDTLAGVNLDKEQQILNMTPGTPVEEPSLGHRVVTFLALLVTTTHPAVWDRRRAALRQREGQLRMEANLRNRMDEGNQDSNREGETRRREVGENARRQHGRRPEWVRRYIGRVLATDWLDDVDVQ